MATYGACAAVGKGGVGESGASSFVHHQVQGATDKMMVVRNDGSSLCPNMGAVASLVINGDPIAHGNITAQGSTVQAEAKPSDHVIVIVHTVPLFNEIMCGRLGELEFVLDECDLVA